MLSETVELWLGQPKDSLSDVDCAVSENWNPEGGSYGNRILYKNLKFFDKIFVRKSWRRGFRNAPYGEKILLMGKSYVWA